MGFTRSGTEIVPAAVFPLVPDRGYRPTQALRSRSADGNQNFTGTQVVTENKLKIGMWRCVSYEDC